MYLRSSIWKRKLSPYTVVAPTCLWSAKTSLAMVRILDDEMKGVHHRKGKLISMVANTSTRWNSESWKTDSLIFERITARCPSHQPQCRELWLINNKIQDVQSLEVLKSWTTRYRQQWPLKFGILRVRQGWCRGLVPSHGRTWTVEAASVLIVWGRAGRAGGLSVSVSIWLIEGAATVASKSQRFVNIVWYCLPPGGAASSWVEHTWHIITYCRLSFIWILVYKWMTASLLHGIYFHSGLQYQTA